MTRAALPLKAFSSSADSRSGNCVEQLAFFLEAEQVTHIWTVSYTGTKC